MTESTGTIHVPHTPHGSAHPPGGPTPSQPSGGNHPSKRRKPSSWYVRMKARTGLSFIALRRLKMLSYGIPVSSEDFALSDHDTTRYISILRKSVPWLVVCPAMGKCKGPGRVKKLGYIVPEDELPRLKQFLEQE